MRSLLLGYDEELEVRRTVPDEAQISARLKSHDPHASTADVVRQIEEALPDLAQHLKSTYGVEEIRLEREATFPIDANTISVTFRLLAKGIVTGIGTKIGQDIYRWLKELWPDLRADVDPISIINPRSIDSGADKQ